jgi:hypothetical protein
MSDLDETRTRLAAAGLPASDAELADLAAALPLQRAAVDALYAVPAARYVDPALRFRADAAIVDWSS